MSTTPPKLNPGDKANFETLLRAGDNGHLILMSAIRKADNKPVALVCASQINPDKTVDVIPLAVLIEGNPFELFEDPTTI